MTFCRIPNDYYHLWKNSENCGQLRYPYFLSYIEDCLELMNENNNNELAMMLDILNKITYSIEDYLQHFIIKGPNHLHFITVSFPHSL